MLPKLKVVRCAACGKVAGADPVIDRIAKCYFCNTGKRKRGQAITAAGKFSLVKKGPAKDLPKRYRDYAFRSSWERNFARVLCKKKIEWTYERHVFTFKDVKRRPFQYIPDFYEVKSGVYWEVKGYLRSVDRSKMRRFRKQYPEEFSKLKACLSRNNKVAIKFYKSMDIPMIHIEDLKQEWKDKIKEWE